MAARYIFEVKPLPQPSVYTPLFMRAIFGLFLPAKIAAARSVNSQNVPVKIPETAPRIEGSISSSPSRIAATICAIASDCSCT